MRGPDEERAARVTPGEPLPGGKVLARLHQFEQERELPQTNIESPAVDKSLVLSPDRSTLMAVPNGHGAVVMTDEQAEASPYLAAFRQLQQLEAEPTAMPVAQGWRPLGPFFIPHGQTYGAGAGSRPSVAGRISAVAVDPSAANHILIGAASGGVWETRDGGVNWSPRTDNQPSCAIGAIAFSPGNPSIVYAGTGEGDFFRRLGAGLLRSTDGGTTWGVIATAPFVGIGFYDLVVDPLNANHLLAATSGGLFESANGGTSWTLRRSVVTWDLSMHPAVAGDPASTREVFAACADGLFRSTDGGATWSAVALPSAPAGYQRVEVCHAPSNGDVCYVFAAGTGGTGHIWRRAAFGGAFTTVTPPMLSTNQAWYDWFAAAAPNNPDVLYLGEIHIWKGVRSPSNAWTWTNISSRSSGPSVHPDQHAIAFSPTNANVIYVGNDGGIYVTPDAGATWRSLNENLCITEFEYLSQHPRFDAWLLGGTQDNGTERYEGEETWYHVQDGDGGDCGTNAATPYTCYHYFTGINLQRSTTGGGWGSWASITPPTPPGFGALFYAPLEVRNNLVVAGGSTVFISTDTGTTWSPVALPAGVASAISIPSPTRVYVGTTLGNVYRIDQSGTTWQAAVALTQPRAGFVSDLLADPYNPNRIWVTYSTIGGGHVFRTDNAGATWTDVSAGLPNIPVNAVEMDPTNPNVLWVAADVGVYRTANAGGSWSSFRNLLPNALAKDLLFQPRLRLLRVAMQSRGVWEIAVDAATMPDVDLYLRDSVVDTGRTLPSQSGVNDPFTVGANTYWWQCTDVKADSPPYRTPALTDVDFGVFDDDHGVFASGLFHEDPQRTRIVRVFVQAHNRGLNPAANVSCKVFFANASLGLPDLPAGFWTNFPNNTVPVNSPWKPVAPHKTVWRVESGHPHVFGFEWNVPVSAAEHTCLLAILTSQNDAVATTELNIGKLVTGNKKCGLKNVHVVNPPLLAPPEKGKVSAMKLDLWGSQAKPERYSLGGDEQLETIVPMVIFSKRLSKLAADAGLDRGKPDDRHLEAIKQLLKDEPGLEAELDLETGYRPPRQKVWMKSLDLHGEKPERMVLMIDPDAAPGYSSVVQFGEDGETVVGGFTVQVQEPGDFGAEAAEAEHDGHEELRVAEEKIHGLDRELAPR